MPDKSKGVENHSTWPQHVADLQSCLPSSLTLWQTCNLPLSPCYLAPILHWSASSYFRRCSVRHCLITELIVLSLEWVPGSTWRNIKPVHQYNLQDQVILWKPLYYRLSSQSLSLIWSNIWGLVDQDDRAVYSFWQRTKVQISYRLSSPM